MKTLRAAGARSGFALWGVASLAGGLAAGLGATGTVGPTAQAQVDSAVAARAAGVNAFGLDLYQQLADSPGNLCFSPFSLASALAMTYAGARGETEAQMGRVMHFGENDEGFHQAYSDLTTAIRAIRELPEGPRLTVANALWAQESYAYLDWYLTLVTERYDAALRNVDFRADPAGVRRTINDWVAQQTAGKIVGLLGPGVLTPLTRLVLANAIYFHGSWVVPFAEESPEEPFLLTGGESVAVPMMHQTDRFGYLEGHGPKGNTFQMLELPYRGGRVAMLLLLPSKDQALGDFTAGITSERLEAWMAELKPVRVAVFLPRFTLSAALDLGRVLSTMGMPDAFHEQTANFSGMTGSAELYVSKVLHKAYLEVSEQGTEAAAASAVAMTLGLSPQDPRAHKPIFRADHPFLFLIRDRETGAILFLGRLVDPRG